MIKIFQLVGFFLILNHMPAQSVSKNFIEALKMPEQITKLEILFSEEGAVNIDSRIAQLVNLEELILINYPNATIELPIALRSLDRLKKISISGFELTEVPEIVYDLVQLENLSLGFFKAKGITKDIERLVHLTSFGIRADQMSTIPMGVYHLKNLKFLKVAGRELENMPDGIANLEKLSTLIIEGMRMETLPTDLSQLENLEEFGLYCKNQISIPLNKNNKSLVKFRWGQCPSFPENLCQISTLKRLTFDDGKMTAIPDCIENLTQLIQIDLSFNPIEELPMAMLKLKNLSSLNLRSSKIKRLDEAFFLQPHKIWINMSYCDEMSEETLKEYATKYGDRIRY